LSDETSASIHQEGNVVKRVFGSGAISGAVAAALAVGLLADARQSSTQEPQTAAEAQLSTAGPSLHLEGCVFPERALSATGSIVVPAGRAEDYVLTETKVLAGSDGATEGGIFRLEQVPQDRLRALIGKRVGVTGRIEDESTPPVFRVTSIREIVGTCPRMGPRL
jgi:hypothetical protein